MTLTKKLISTKVATVVVGLAMVFSLVAAVPANAQTTADLQAQITALLAQISALQAQLGQVTGGGGSMTTGTCTFTRDLTLGATGDDVSCLQNALMGGGFTIPALASGAASHGYFGSQTQTAVAAWQKANNVTPPAGYFGPKSRASWNLGGGSTSGGGSGTVIPSGTALSVVKSVDSPANVALIQGQAIADLAHFTFTNPTGSEALITNIAFDRIGVSNDTTLPNVFLYQGATRITDSASVSQSRLTFNDAGGVLRIPANSTVTISVRADIAASTAGQIVGVSLVSVASNVALASTVTLPVAGNMLSIASASLAGVNYNTTTTPSAASIDPQDEYTMWANTVSITTRAVDLYSMTFRQIGSVNTGDLRNFKLFIDGTQVGSTVASLDSRGYVTFDLSAAPVRLQTGSRVVKLLGDVVGGSTRTFSFSLRQAGDGMFLDSELKQPVLAQAASATFSARTSGDQTVNSGTLTITKKSTSPSGNVVADASNVTLGVFEMKAAGEKLKVENLRVAVVEGAGETAYTLRNGALFANGVQVGSTASIAATTDSTLGYTEFSLGSSLVLEPGTPVDLEVKADIYDNDGTNQVSTSDTIQATIVAGSSNVQRLNALTYLSNSAVTANSLTVATGSLAGSKYSAYANQTTVVPKTAMKLGEFRVVADSTEGVNLNTITLDFSASSSTAQVTSYLTDVYVTYGDKTTSTKATVSGSSDNTWNINHTLPANQELAVVVYGTLGAGFGDTDTLRPDIEFSGTTASSAASATTGEISGQTITVSTGSIASELITDSTLNTRQLVGSTSGASSPKVASFRFIGTNDSYTITDINLKVNDTNAAGGIGSITLKSSGMTDKTFSLNGTTGTSTGLSLNVPANDSSGRIVDVYLNLADVGSSAATTSNDVQITLDGFKAIATGSGTETYDGTDRAGNANYVFKSIPTLTAGTLSGSETTLSAGSNKVLGRVNVTADAAGSIEWKKMVFTVNKTAAITLGATTTITLWQGSTQVTGSVATTTGSLATASQACSVTDTACTIIFEATNPQQLAAGTTATYELRATVGGIATGYNYVSLSLANDNTTRTAPNTYAIIAGTASVPLGPATTPFVWSDRSSLSHSASTPDWHNDYLVKNLPLSLSTVAVTI